MLNPKVSKKLSNKNYQKIIKFTAKVYKAYESGFNWVYLVVDSDGALTVKCQKVFLPIANHTITIIIKMIIIDDRS